MLKHPILPRHWSNEVQGMSSNLLCQMRQLRVLSFSSYRINSLVSCFLSHCSYIISLFVYGLNLTVSQALDSESSSTSSGRSLEYIYIFFHSLKFSSSPFHRYQAVYAQICQTHNAFSPGRWTMQLLIYLKVRCQKRSYSSFNLSRKLFQVSMRQRVMFMPSFTPPRFRDSTSGAHNVDLRFWLQVCRFLQLAIMYVSFTISCGRFRLCAGSTQPWKPVSEQMLQDQKQRRGRISPSTNGPGGEDGFSDVKLIS